VGAIVSPFIFNDAIISLAQSLTEAPNQVASSLRRTCDLIEELGRRKGFYLNLAGGSNGRAAGAVFYNAHLPDKLPGAHGAKEDGLAIDFPEYLNGTAENAKNSVRWISLSEEHLPLCEVRASHCSSSRGAGLLMFPRRYRKLAGQGIGTLVQFGNGSVIDAVMLCSIAASKPE